MSLVNITPLISTLSTNSCMIILSDLFENCFRNLLINLIKFTFETFLFNVKELYSALERFSLSSLNADDLKKNL